MSDRETWLNNIDELDFFFPEQTVGILLPVRLHAALVNTQQHAKSVQSYL